MNKQGTWTLVDKPKDRKPVGSKWVFDIKKDRQGKIERYKARLVAKGYSQVPGMDYFDTYSPVVRLESLRALLAIAATEDLEIRQLDVKGAYLHGELKEEVYMVQPPGFEDETDRVCHLNKTLYGLKQSGREWNRKLHEILTHLEFKRVEMDHGVYIRRVKDQFIIITIWVDDLLFFSNSTLLMDATQLALQKEVELKITGELEKIIGIEIYRDRKAKTIQISQEKYIDGILKRFGYEDMSPVSTPMDPNVILEKCEGVGKLTDSRGHSYSEHMGSMA